MDSLKGNFLVAMPAMADINFSHTVTCIAEHTAEGALGVVVNRVLPAISAKTIFEELKLDFTQGAEKIPVHIGGPVHENEIFILHGAPFDWEGSLMITPTVAMSNTMDVIRALAKGEGPKSFIIALGCAGWAPDQLEFELAQNAWLTCPLNEKIMFEDAMDSRWAESVKMMGINPMLLSNTPGHA
jgi:putative transcriptional regulator